MTPVTLVTGARAAARESIIHRTIAAAATSLNAAAGGERQSVAVVLEGMPDGSGMLENNADLQLARIAPGCLCCTGNIVLRVTLNRILRDPPSHLYIGLADTGHLDRIRSFLSEPPYSRLLTLTADLAA